MVEVFYSLALACRAVVRPLPALLFPSTQTAPLPTPRILPALDSATLYIGSLEEESEAAGSRKEQQEEEERGRR